MMSIKTPIWRIVGNFCSKHYGNQDACLAKCIVLFRYIVKRRSGEMEMFMYGYTIVCQQWCPRRCFGRSRTDPCPPICPAGSSTAAQRNS